MIAISHVQDGKILWGVTVPEDLHGKQRKNKKAAQRKRLHYPRNWQKVSRVLRRLAGGYCEWCGLADYQLSVHHIGIARPTGSGWTVGNPLDKHDVRRENLVCLCTQCHQSIELYNPAQKHHHLNIGTGLIVYCRPTVRVDPLTWDVMTRLHYALIRASKRSGKNFFRLPYQPRRIIDSHLIRKER